MTWVPKRTLAEVEALLCAPGMPHELEQRVINGQELRVYKNVWSSMREFWLECAGKFSGRTYIVYEDQRWTYGQILRLSVQAALVFAEDYHVVKGDRVGICSRNLPEYMIAFWACHLIGAVPVLANAWLPVPATRHVLAHASCKVVCVDVERASSLERIVPELCKTTICAGFLVFGGCTGRPHIQSWEEALNTKHSNLAKLLDVVPDITPEDPCLIIFTSGTTGLPKGVFSTQRMVLTTIRNITMAGRRAALRRGEDIARDFPIYDRGVLIPVPFFHVTGSTSLAMYATLHGAKMVLIRRWAPNEVARLIKQEDIGVAGGVPSMVLDLVESECSGFPLDALLFGGAAAPNHLPARAASAFGQTLIAQNYGMTEANSMVTSAAGEDYAARTSSSGLTSPVNDIRIMKDGRHLRTGEIGEIWIRGPNVMTGYWRDPEATSQVLTTDGWLKSGDLGYVDSEGFLYVKDRIKDIIIRGGENIDSVMVEDALYANDCVLEVAVVGVPDARLGEVVVAVVYPRPSQQGRLTETDLLEDARQRLPKFAAPVMIIIMDEPLPRTPSAKITKPKLRDVAKVEWSRRQHAVYSPSSQRLRQTTTSAAVSAKL